MYKEKLWTKEFIILAIINFLLTIIFFLLIVTIPGYAQSEYNSTTSISGLVSSIFILGSVFGRLFAGGLITRFGSQRILMFGLLNIFIISILYFFAFNLTFLIFIRLINGIAAGIATTAAGTIIAQIVPESRKGEGIGYYSLSITFGTAIGPMIGILLLGFESGFLMLFALNVLVGLICLILNIVVKLDIPEQSTTNEVTTKESFLTTIIERKAIPISLITFGLGFTYSSVMTYLTFYAEEINLVTAAGYFFLVYSIVVIFTRPFTGTLMDLKGANIVMYPCFIIFSSGMLLFSQASTGWMLLLAAALIGIGYGNFNSIGQAIAIKVTEPHRVGLATSTYFIFFDFSYGVGPFLMGFLVPYLGYRTLFFVMAIFILLFVPIYYFLHGRKDRQLIKLVVKGEAKTAQIK